MLKLSCPCSVMGSAGGLGYRKNARGLSAPCHMILSVRCQVQVRRGSGVIFSTNEILV